MEHDARRKTLKKKEEEEERKKYICDVGIMSKKESESARETSADGKVIWQSLVFVFLQAVQCQIWMGT